MTTITLRCDSCNVMYESDDNDSPCAECGSDRIYEVTRAERLQEIDRAEIARLAAEDSFYQRKSVIELPVYSAGFLRKRQAGGGR